MRALVATGDPDDPAELAEAAEPEPGSNEALVEVRAISLNRGESNQLVRAERGWRPGWDFAGLVARPAADGSGPPGGARVVGFLESGAWAERIAVTSDRVGVLPDDVSFVDASTLPIAGITALRCLRAGGTLVGRRVLVTGAAGGVGHFAVQLAARAGARVTAVVGRPERGRGLVELGAAEVVTGIDAAEGPFDLVLESVGGASLARALDLVGHLGTVVTFGNSSREDTTFRANAFYGPGTRRLYGFLIFHREAVPYARDLELLAGLVAAAELSTGVTVTTPWHEASEAVRALLDRRVEGKAVLEVS
jgi:NADPH2:quinone reductase